MQLLCLGDSLTYGYDVAPEQRWTRILERETGAHIDNQGACGDTTSGMLYRLRQLDLSRYDAYFLMGGSNDILEDIPLQQIAANMETMVGLLEQQHKPIYLGIPPLTLPESALYGWQESSAVEEHNKTLTAYRDWLLALGKHKEIPLLDWYAILQQHPYYADGVHPNAQGYRLLAEEAARILGTD